MGYQLAIICYITDVSRKAKGILFLLLASLLYSIMSVLIRFLGQNGIPPASQVFLRYIFAFTCASIYFKATSKTKIKIDKKDLPILLCTTIIGYALTNLFVTYGFLTNQIGSTLFLLNSYAIIAPLLGFFFLKDKVNVFNLISFALTFIALFLLFQPTSFNTWKTGAIFAVLGAVTQAIYIVLRKKLKYPANFIMFANTLTGVAVLGFISLALDTSFYFNGAISHVPSVTWIVIILFGIDNFFAWFCVTKGFEYFNNVSATLVLLAEVIFGIIFAFFFFSEIPTIATFIGGVLIILASVLTVTKGET